MSTPALVRVRGKGVKEASDVASAIQTYLLAERPETRQAGPFSARLPTSGAPSGTGLKAPRSLPHLPERYQRRDSGQVADGTA